MKTKTFLVFAAFVAAIFTAPFLVSAPAYDTTPVPVKTPPPVYPLSLKREGVSGVVAVSVVIDETGSVASASVAKSTHPDFDAPAIEAVKKWKFKPAQKDGEPAKCIVLIPIKFNLDE